MHQDQRVGLALGVLLIGACAAFFFRNETLEKPKTPQLQHAQQLDDRISERATRPYLKGVEAVEAGDRSRLRSVSDRGLEESSAEEDHGSYWSPVESSGSRKSKDRSSGLRKPHASMTDLEGDVQEMEPIPVPSDGIRANGLAQIQDGPENKGPKSDAASSESHVVQKGETLTSIATKRLGNPNRFHEIFEANQDQLKDANDLKMGMVLRLPENRGESMSKPIASKGRRSSDKENSVSLESTASSDEPVPSSIGRPTAAPRSAIDEQLTSGDTDKPQIDPRTDSTPTENPSRKFVAARRFTPPTRPRQ